MSSSELDVAPVVHVWVLSGSGLAAKDSISKKSDPFVKIWFLDEAKRVLNTKTEIFQTDVVASNLNPVFCAVEPHASRRQWYLEAATQEARPIAAIKFECWDKDLVTDDFMGETIVYLKDVTEHTTDDADTVNQVRKHREAKDAKVDTSSIFTITADLKSFARKNEHVSGSLTVQILYQSQVTRSQLRAQKMNALASRMTTLGLSDQKERAAEIARLEAYHRNCFKQCSPAVAAALAGPLAPHDASSSSPSSVGSWTGRITFQPNGELTSAVREALERGAAVAKSKADNTDAPDYLVMELQFALSNGILVARLDCGDAHEVCDVSVSQDNKQSTADNTSTVRVRFTPRPADRRGVPVEDGVFGSLTAAGLSLVMEAQLGNDSVQVGDGERTTNSNNSQMHNKSNTSSGGYAILPILSGYVLALSAEKLDVVRASTTAFSVGQLAGPEAAVGVFHAKPGHPAHVGSRAVVVAYAHMHNQNEWQSNPDYNSSEKALVNAAAEQQGLSRDDSVDGDSTPDVFALVGRRAGGMRGLAGALRP